MHTSLYYVNFVTVYYCHNLLEIVDEANPTANASRNNFTSVPILRWVFLSNDFDQIG